MGSNGNMPFTHVFSGMGHSGGEEGGGGGGGSHDNLTHQCLF